MSIRKSKFDFEKNGVIVLVFSILIGLLNYLYQIIMGGLLAPADYGLLNALLSLSVVISIPTNTLQTVAAKYSAHFTAQDEKGKLAYVVKRLTRWEAFAAAIVLVAGIALSGIISRLLNIENRSYIILIIFAVSLNCFLPCAFGALQGQKRFVAYSFVSVIGTLGKIVFGVLFVLLGFHMYGITASIIISIAITVAYAIFMTREYLFSGRIQPVQINLGDLKGYFKAIFFIQTILLVVTSGDVLIIKALTTDAAEVGYYSAAATICKIPLYISTTAATVLFPTVAQQKAQGMDTKRIFLKALLYGGGSACLISSALIIFRKLIIHIIYGSQYAPATSLFLPTSCFVLALTLLTIVINYQSARNALRTPLISMLTGLIITVPVIYFVKSSIAGILYALSMGLLFAFVWNLAAILKDRTNLPN